MITIIKYGYYTGKGFKNKLILCQGKLFDNVNQVRKTLKLPNGSYETIVCHCGSISARRHTIQVLKENGYSNLLGSFGLPSDQ